MDKHRIEPGEGVHQWLTSEAFRYFSDRISGSELEDRIGTWEQDGVFGNLEQDTVLDGARDEDMGYKPPLWQGTDGTGFDLESPSMRHFCASAEEMYLGYFFLIQYHSNMRQAELIWSDHPSDNLLMRHQMGDRTTPYYYLGHVAHLLQDMCTPAHTHNDPHGSSLVSLHDSYEQDYVPAHFQEYRFDNERFGQALLTNLALEVPDSLFDLFQATAEYTDDYDSNHADGEYALKGADACFFPDDFPASLLHHPEAALRTGGGATSTLTESGCAVVADDLMYWAMKQTAELFRLFYRETDSEVFSGVFRMNGLSLSTDEHTPTEYDGPQKAILQLSYTSGEQEGFPPSGIVKSSCTVFHDYRPEGGTWSGVQLIPFPECVGSLALESEPGLHKLWVGAENGGGYPALTSPQYYQAAGFGLVDASPGGLYEEGQRLRLEVHVSGASDAVTYQWQKEGMPLISYDSPVLEIGFLQLDDEGVYQCVITDAGKSPIVTPECFIRVRKAETVPISGIGTCVVLIALFATLYSCWIHCGQDRNHERKAPRPR